MILPRLSERRTSVAQRPTLTGVDPQAEHYRSRDGTDRLSRRGSTSGAALVQTGDMGNR
jgi:hypothetical protein